VEDIMDGSESSDWEKFFSMCAASETYRSSLSEALEQGNDTEIRRLLREIGVDDTDNRVAALRALNGPFRDLFDQFGGQPRLIPAP
jgi:hypothetical protein